MATMEFNSGNSKKGQKLFNESLFYPNENILAQSRYISNKFNKVIETNFIQIPCTYERDSWLSYKAGNFKKVVEDTNNWFYFQPFSKTPAVMNSYINSLIFNNEKESIDIATKALVVSPDDFSLLNNKVVSMYRNNDIENANTVMRELEKIKISEMSEGNVFLATKGLAFFRNGNITEGEKHYKLALDFFKEKNATEKYCRALYYLSWEERRVNDVSYRDRIREAFTLSKKNSYNDIECAIKNNFSNEIKYL